MKLKDVLGPLDPDNDNPANMFPLDLCSTILFSLDSSKIGPTQDFISLLVRDFQDSVPYFLDKIYNSVLCMFSKFVKDPSLNKPSLPQSLRVFVVAIKFMLHRLSLPNYNMSYSTIRWSLTDTVEWISHQTFSTQEATAAMMVLNAIIAPCLDLLLSKDSDGSDWSRLCFGTILAYQSLTTVPPSAWSLCGLQPIVDFMTSHWNKPKSWADTFPSNAPCEVLTNLLANHIPVAFTVFLSNQCLQFLGNNMFHKASVSMVSIYVTGLSAMQQRLDGVLDAKTL
ncbi:hypothetical protein EDD85DRAFT_958850 [Armillaria nabsnona]|nr:hypothetical protein EDD85DRAFT_958850 [Armillaria nabsnona]